MTAEEVLAKAADLVERPGGWCQHALVKGEAVCLVGALYVAAGLMGLGKTAGKGTCQNSGALRAAREAVDREVGATPTFSAADWNNALARDAIEVATAFRNSKRHLVAR